MHLSNGWMLETCLGSLVPAVCGVRYSSGIDSTIRLMRFAKRGHATQSGGCGEFDGIVRLAGLKRLGQENVVTQIIDEGLMLPAVGQGALGIACRSSDNAVRDKLAPLDHLPTRLAVTAERGLLAVLEGSCKVPIAGHGKLLDGRITLRGLVGNLAGTIVIADEITGDAGNISAARELGLKLGKQLVERGAGAILAEISQSGAAR
jgi:hydroxymethylbilane synthase